MMSKQSMQVVNKAVKLTTLIAGPAIPKPTFQKCTASSPQKCSRVSWVSNAALSSPTKLSNSDSTGELTPFPFHYNVFQYPSSNSSIQSPSNAEPVPVRTGLVTSFAALRGGVKAAFSPTARHGVFFLKLDQSIHEHFRTTREAIREEVGLGGLSQLGSLEESIVMHASAHRFATSHVLMHLAIHTSSNLYTTRG
jgi:hypothetical protein